jgi:hypothetical protein
MAREASLTCNCGEVVLEIEGRHIISTECCCESCRQAGAHLQSLPGAPSFLEPNGNTRFVLYRKDRVRCEKGADALKEYRLKPEAKTRRVVATCCNTPMFLEFTQGHWLSLYGHLWPDASLPALEMRTMAGDLPNGVSLPDDVPNAKTHSLKFFARLIGAWAAMRFRTPKIAYVDGELNAP